MKNANHTPGPWDIQPTIDGYWLVIEEDCQVTDTSDVSEEDCVAQVGNVENVTLIASAPELLKALEEIVNLHPGELMAGEAFNIASQAIAKAKGE